MQSDGLPSLTWTKAIPKQRDRLQSQTLTWVAGGILLAGTFPCFFLAVASAQSMGGLCRRALAVSIAFGVLVRLLRAATAPAAVVGGSVCFLVTALTGLPGRSIFASGLSPMIGLFLLTFTATRLARWRGVKNEVSEVRNGRRASQVVANLGWAGLLALLTFLYKPGALEIGVLLVAVLAEATADTVSSEVGQAAGGQPRLLGSWRRVEPGTDGAVSTVGTLAGVLGAALIGLVGLLTMQMTVRSAGCAVLAAVGGLFLDSLLGATLERKGWLGNDLVNFLSNGFSGLMALLLLRLHL